MNSKITNNLSNISFRFMKESDIEPTAKFLAKTFSQHDPFFKILKVDEQNLYFNIKQDLESIKDINMVVLAIEEDTGKVVGAKAGLRFDRYKLPGSIVDKFEVDLEKVKTMTHEEKHKILDDIDTVTLKHYYDQHKENGELEKTIFVDYYCVAKEYFSTNLAKTLASTFLMEMYLAGIDHLYCHIFNPKSSGSTKNLVNLVTLEQINVNIIDKNKNINQFPVSLRYLYKQEIRPKF